MIIKSHLMAGTGAVLVSTREEARLLSEILAELPEDVEVSTIAAPSGQVRNARTGKSMEIAGLGNAYAWTADGPGRVLVVYDFHVLVNNAGMWRALIDNLPLFRSPRMAGDGDLPSLVVFVGPAWDLQHTNPLKGAIPTIDFKPPNRDALKKIANSLHTLNGNGESIVDALCGLAADTAEQAAAECLAAKGKWDPEYLRAARVKLIKEAGLEIWPTTLELGGLSSLRDWSDKEMIPWIRDEQLSIRRILSAGLPGTGKSYFARYLAGKLKCECVRLSIPSLKAGIVGSSEANLRRALNVLDTLGAEAPIVCVIDEIDTIAREGNDSGTSSGLFAELLTWLQESKAKVIVVATLNHLDKLDAALESRFQARFFFDLPVTAEREAVAEIHYARLKCADPKAAAKQTAAITEGFSSREIAEQVCPSVARLTNRIPNQDAIAEVCKLVTPASKTQAEKLKTMKNAAQSLRRANDAEVEVARQAGRRIAGKQVA